jgi:hypothetical protein
VTGRPAVIIPIVTTLYNKHGLSLITGMHRSGKLRLLPGNVCPMMQMIVCIEQVGDVACYEDAFYLYTMAVKTSIPFTDGSPC